MKPKDQITLGLITAFAGIGGVLFFFFKYCLTRHDHIIYVISPLGLIAPTAYAVFLIRRKATPARETFWMWFAGWVVYVCLATLNLAYSHHLLAGKFSPAVETIYYFLAVITAFPVFAFIFSTWQTDPFIRHLIVGTIIMGLLWTGQRGIAKSEQS
jgi:hypothetical protein